MILMCQGRAIRHVVQSTKSLSTNGAKTWGQFVVEYFRPKFSLVNKHVAGVGVAGMAPILAAIIRFNSSNVKS